MLDVVLSALSGLRARGMKRTAATPQKSLCGDSRMYTIRLPRLFGTLALFAAFNFSAHAQEVKTVFVIAMENHNWTQPANQSGGIQQIFRNPNAPFINSLVDGTAWAEIGGRTQHISEQVAYASAYHNVLATANGSNPHIHPSEPN